MRRLRLAALLLAVALGFAACGGGGSSGGGGGELVVGSAIKRAFRPDETAPRSFNSPAGAAAMLATNPAGARPWLVELYEHGEASDRAVTHAICAGMAQLADFPSGKVATNWPDFLTGYVARYWPNVSKAAADAEITEVTQVWDLALVEPADAATYWKACRA